MPVPCRPEQWKSYFTQYGQLVYDRVLLSIIDVLSISFYLNKYTPLFSAVGAQNDLQHHSRHHFILTATIFDVG